MERIRNMCVVMASEATAGVLELRMVCTFSVRIVPVNASTVHPVYARRRVGPGPAGWEWTAVDGPGRARPTTSATRCWSPSTRPAGRQGRAESDAGRDDPQDHRGPRRRVKGEIRSAPSGRIFTPSRCDSGCRPDSTMTACRAIIVVGMGTGEPAVPPARRARMCCGIFGRGSRAESRAVGSCQAMRPRNSFRDALRNYASCRLRRGAVTWWENRFGRRYRCCSEWVMVGTVRVPADTVAGRGSFWMRDPCLSL